MSAILFPLFTTLALVVVAYLGVRSAGLHYLFGVVIPYAAIAIFLLGVVYRVLRWARVPVPFRIPTTCGQQKSLPWIKNSNLESPHNLIGVIGRMALEILFFRSLFRNTRFKLKEGGKGRLVYGPTKWLWLAGLAFHWSFLIIFVRHFKYFVEPVPEVIRMAGELDGFFQIGVPVLYATDVLILAALTYLFLRRVFIPYMRYISMAADFFPLMLILGIAISGVWMRYFGKVDLFGVKELAIGLVSFRPTAPATIGSAFYIHLFLVSTLLVYFPFSKLVHMGGVFLSPTRNLANNNRMVRYINPWNYPVKTHPYHEYEDEFRELMAGCGLPLDKPLEQKAEPAQQPAGKEE
jgi:nitrate reductase gamma subunit